MEEKQELIDLMFRMILVVTDDPIFCARPRGEKIAWVANSLRHMGYDTHPMGMSWGVLVDKEYREKVPVITDNLDN